MRTADGNEYRAWAVLLALARPTAGSAVPGEEDFIGAGVHFCATCDGAFYREKEVLVVGGGNSAGEESIFLTKFAGQGHDRHARHAALARARSWSKRSTRHPKIDVHHRRCAGRVRGRSKLRGGRVRRTMQSGERTRDLARAGVFVFIGLTPNTKLVEGMVGRRRHGLIATDGGPSDRAFRDVFAAGDVPRRQHEAGGVGGRRRSGGRAGHSALPGRESGYPATGRDADGGSRRIDRRPLRPWMR